MQSTLHLKVILFPSPQDPDSHEVTDMMSFYHLPSTVVSHPVHKSLHVAYAFYYFSTKVPLKELMQDALILAKNVSQLFPCLKD